jgi:hypothetical protein
MAVESMYGNTLDEIGTDRERQPPDNEISWHGFGASGPSISSLLREMVILSFELKNLQWVEVGDEKESEGSESLYLDRNLFFNIRQYLIVQAIQETGREIGNRWILCHNSKQERVSIAYAMLGDGTVVLIDHVPSFRLDDPDLPGNW